MTKDNQSKAQANNNNGKTKKDTRKCCEFHKNPTHNTNECRAKQSLLVEMKYLESDACSNFESLPDKENEKGKWIINVEPNATVATIQI